jgi:uncharacterized protein (DUF1330 family)
MEGNMSAFIIFQSNVTDRARFQEYAKRVPATLEPYGGEVVLKGRSETIYQGGNRYANVGILSFPDLASAAAWYESDAYQALVEDRNTAAEMNIVSYEAA